ncbi:protein NRT1/ PTR FAMILY 2.3 [Dendrobium catenatum]|uniref:Putative nitrate excretion transporter 5 n=1 Tax=Dendrobium catenatum TaxID=906689 RepID=A0A2I0WHM7_9ASPA|nr:protein NRT1/ PTR FAMILY 2.3 [Dendrobium catenatum]PKU75164.1 putative nitrate excretion transporter 5 [Dendrobium catenatum]
MDEALLPHTDEERGGWKTFPFIIGAIMGVAMVAYGVSSNLEVYLIKGFNVGQIDATQINGIASGCISFAPVVGGVLADSFLGCSAVLAAAVVACFLGMLLFTLTAILPSLHPPPCAPPTPCQPPMTAHLTVLFTAIALLATGVAGTRYNGMTMGANQFSTDSDRTAFFNWCFVSLYLSSIAGTTILVYIQDSAGWHWGFALCTAITAIAFLFYLFGRPYYLHSKPNLSRNHLMSFCREGKLLIRFLPIISSGILLSATISVQTSLTVLQALAMDRSLTHNFFIPAGSMNVFVLATAATSITVLGCTRCRLSPLSGITIGHVINMFAMVAMALTESRRLAVVATNTFSVLWLVPPLVLIGFGEAFHFPASVAFYYQDFPASLRSTATGTFAVVSGTGFYMSSAIIAVIRRSTNWLQDDVNESRLDNVYLTLAGCCLLNFVYFLLCAWLYKKNTENREPKREEIY